MSTLKIPSSEQAKEWLSKYEEILDGPHRPAIPPLNSVHRGLDTIALFMDAPSPNKRAGECIENAVFEFNELLTALQGVRDGAGVSSPLPFFEASDRFNQFAGLFSEDSPELNILRQAWDDYQSMATPHIAKNIARAMPALQKILGNQSSLKPDESVSSALSTLKAGISEINADGNESRGSNPAVGKIFNAVLESMGCPECNLWLDTNKGRCTVAAERGIITKTDENQRIAAALETMLDEAHASVTDLERDGNVSCKTDAKHADLLALDPRIIAMKTWEKLLSSPTCSSSDDVSPATTAKARSNIFAAALGAGIKDVVPWKEKVVEINFDPAKERGDIAPGAVETTITIGVIGRYQGSKMKGIAEAVSQTLENATGKKIKSKMESDDHVIKLTFPGPIDDLQTLNPLGLYYKTAQQNIELSKGTTRNL